MDLKLYGTRWCRDCRVARAFLERHGIRYVEVDIEDDPGAAEEVERHTGKRAIPQFVLNGLDPALPAPPRFPV